jgi:hypothetical protein
MILCAQNSTDQAPTGIEYCEILIFHCGLVGNTLVNLWSTDIRNMPAVIEW